MGRFPGPFLLIFFILWFFEPAFGEDQILSIIPLNQPMDDGPLRDLSSVRLTPIQEFTCDGLVSALAERYRLERITKEKSKKTGPDTFFYRAELEDYEKNKANFDPRYSRLMEAYFEDRPLKLSGMIDPFQRRVPVEVNSYTIFINELKPLPINQIEGKPQVAVEIISEVNSVEGKYLCKPELLRFHIHRDGKSTKIYEYDVKACAYYREALTREAWNKKAAQEYGEGFFIFYETRHQDLCDQVVAASDLKRPKVSPKNPAVGTRK